MAVLTCALWKAGKDHDVKEHWILNERVGPEDANLLTVEEERLLKEPMLRYHVPTQGSEAEHSFGEARFMKAGVLNKQKAQIMTRGDGGFAASQPKTGFAGGRGGNFVILGRKQNSQKD